MLVLRKKEAEKEVGDGLLSSFLNRNLDSFLY